MTNRQYFLEKFKSELPVFMRVFKAVEATPKSKHGHRHDPKGKSALELMSHTFAMEGGSLVDIVKKGEVDFFARMQKPLPKTIKDASKVFEKEYKKVISHISKMKDAEWEKGKAEMMSGKKVEWATTKMDMMWGMLFDMVHHRGQLSTYIRPMGGKVPSIYGPSADTK
ncbi:MAG: DinB family protein [Minisyncoccia bacterium]